MEFERCPSAPSSFSHIIGEINSPQRARVAKRLHESTVACGYRCSLCDINLVPNTVAFLGSKFSFPIYSFHFPGGYLIKRSQIKAEKTEAPGESLYIKPDRVMYLSKFDIHFSSMEFEQRPSAPSSSFSRIIGEVNSPQRARVAKRCMGVLVLAVIVAASVTCGYLIKRSQIKAEKMEAPGEGFWCVAKPAAPTSILTDNVNYACEGKKNGTCDFKNTGIITVVDPSYGSCIYQQNP
ncbi:hypothetical protein AgCh_003087 [Apium graveolens]